MTLGIVACYGRGCGLRGCRTSRISVRGAWAPPSSGSGGGIAASSHESGCDLDRFLPGYVPPLSWRWRTSGSGNIRHRFGVAWPELPTTTARHPRAAEHDHDATRAQCPDRLPASRRTTCASSRKRVAQMMRVHIRSARFSRCTSTRSTSTHTYGVQAATRIFRQAGIANHPRRSGVACRSPAGTELLNPRASRGARAVAHGPRGWRRCLITRTAARSPAQHRSRAAAGIARRQRPVPIQPCGRSEDSASEAADRSRFLSRPRSTEAPADHEEEVARQLVAVESGAFESIRHMARRATRRVREWHRISWPRWCSRSAKRRTRVDRRTIITIPNSIAH